MATNYKRHSQGGRFRRTDAGDMGIRAYKDQQDRIIAALKAQNKQQQQYSNEYKRDIEGNAVQELQHNRELKRLTDDVHKVAMDNTRIRAEREIESLETQAKEAGKKSDFWKDFSTTYSKQYAETAGNIADKITDKQAEHQVQVIEESDEWDIITRQTDALNKISSWEQVSGMMDALQDKSLSREERRDILAHFSDLGFRMNSKAQDIIVTKLLKEWKQQHSDLDRMATEHGVGLTHKTIKDYYNLRKNELLTQLGISPTSPAGRKLIKGINNKLAEKIGPLNDTWKATTDTQTLDHYRTNAFQWVGAEGSIDDYYTSQNSRIILSAGAYRFDENNRVVKPQPGVKPNPVDHWKIVAEEDIKAGHFKSLDQAKTHLLHMPTPGSEYVCDETGCKYTETWGGRHPGLEEELNRMWTERAFEQSKKDDDNLRDRGKAIIDDIHQRIENGDINITNNDQLQQLKKSYEDYVHKEANVVDMLDEYIVFNQMDKDNNIVNMALYNTYADIDVKNLNKYMKFLDPATRENWESRKKQITELSANGYNKTDIRQLATDKLYTILGIDSTKGTIRGYAEVINAIEQDFLFEYAAVSELPNAEKMSVTQKLDLMNERIQNKIDKKLGIYRRDGSGLETKFLAFSTENDDSNAGADVNQLEASINKFGLDNVFKTLTEKNGKFYLDDEVSEVNLVSTDALDTVIKSLKKSEPIGYISGASEIIAKIVEAQGAEKEFEERDVWNLILKSKGLDYFIPPGAIDLSKWQIKQSDVDVTEREYSKEDTNRISLYLEAVELGLIDKNFLEKHDLNYNVENSWINNENFKSNFDPYFSLGDDSSEDSLIGKFKFSERHMKLLVGEKAYELYFNKGE